MELILVICGGGPQPHLNRTTLSGRATSKNNIDIRSRLHNNDTTMGQFDWFAKIGATPEAVAVLNDQPHLFTILIIVLIALVLQCVLHWYIHYATMKPEQKKKKEKKGEKKGPEQKR